MTHIFAAARVHPAQGIHQSVALIERGAILRVVLVDIQREKRRVDRGVRI